MGVRETQDLEAVATGYQETGVGDCAVIGG